MTRFIVRKAAPEDADGVLDCLHAAFAPYREHYTAEGYADTTLTPETIHQRLREMTVFLAEREGEPVVAGTIACACAHSGEGHIRGMAVLPIAQGSGLAAKLLHAAEDELRRLGCRRVTLDTTAPLQRAIRFYERHGYQRTGKVGDFFGRPLYEFAKDL